MFTKPSQKREFFYGQLGSVNLSKNFTIRGYVLGIRVGHKKQQVIIKSQIFYNNIFESMK